MTKTCGGNMRLNNMNLKNSQFNLNYLLGSGALALTTFLLMSCDPYQVQTEPNKSLVARKQQEANIEKVNQYILNLKSWNELAPEKPDLKKLSGTYQVQDLNTVHDTANAGSSTQQTPATAQSCTVKEFDMTRTPEKIVMQNPAAGILYPGALIQGEGYLQGPGGLRELPIRLRAPIAISIDLVGKKTSTIIDNIDYASYQQAYSDLIQNAMANNTPVSGHIAFNQVEAQKTEQAALDLGFSVKYMGQSLNGELHTQTNSQENTFMAVFEHRAFTISAVTPATPAGFFSSQFTEADLKTQEAQGNIGPQNPPLYVSSVTYGRMLMFTVTSKASKADIQGALNAIYNNVLTEADVKLQAKYQKIMNEASLKVISFGGDITQAEALIKSGNLKDYFSKVPNLDSYVPLSYVFRNMRDNSIAKVSETTQYRTQECMQNPVKAWTVQISLESIKIKHGLSDIGRVFAFGTIMLNNKLVWNQPQLNDYITLKKDVVYPFSKDRNTIEATLSMASTKEIPLSVTLKENMLPGINIFKTSAELAIFTDNLGYTLDGRVQEDGTYTIQKENIDLVYSVKRLKAIY